jgi:1-phosphatidylinositol-4-phosphate 5-kinase
MQFRENMGLLGLGTVYYLSDRIFDMLDDDKDGKIRFEDFAMYFDKISYGDQREKAEISFRLIDKK